MDYDTLAKLVKSLRDRKVSAKELVDHAIKRIEKLDTRINAIVVRDFDRARKQARTADAALVRGDRRLLLGVPMTVKEAFDIAELPTTWGIPGMERNIAKEDAVAISRLKAAGAIILGKSNVPTMLADWQSANPIYGTTNNPWDLTRTPGGSSGGGAAAVAAGYVPLEFGSDLAGSLRTPAHFCGIFAHNPTREIIPMRGLAPPGVPMLSVAQKIDLVVVGPMARCADDLMQVLDVTAGPDEHEAAACKFKLPSARHAKLKDYRVLVLDQHPLMPTEAAITAQIHAMARRLEKSGCKVGRTTPLLPDLAAIGRTYMALLMAFIGSDIPDADYAAAVDRKVKTRRDDTDLSIIAKRAMAMSHRDWVKADQQRTMLKHQWREFFREWDVVICPVMPTVAFPHETRPMDQRDILVDGVRLSYGHQPMWISLATLTGQPSTAMPIGLSPAGLPVGMQIIGPYLEDRTTIKFASLVEKEFGGFVAPPLWA